MVSTASPHRIDDADADDQAPDEPVDEVPPDGPDQPDEGGDGDGELPVGPPGLSWQKALVLGLALAFLGFAFATFMNRDQSPSSDSVDVGFLQDMITHHEQGVAMAQSELVNGSDPTVQSFAREILMFQSMEIGQMDQILHEWGDGRGSPTREAMTWMNMSTTPETMPGMATKEQLAELRSATGAEADALFLELMAEHHLGGIHMAEYAAEHADSSAVKVIASSIAQNQAVEINEFAETAERLGLPIEIEKVEVPSTATE